MSEPSKGNDDRDSKDRDRTPSARVLDAKQLFCGDKEVWIVYGGARYRLRLTRRGRLILTK